MYALTLWSLVSLWSATALATTNGWPVQSFVTEAFHPAKLLVNKFGATASGYLFFATEADNTAAGKSASFNPMIMTDAGELIWQSELTQSNGAYGSIPQLYTNINVQQVNGTPYLTYFNGTLTRGHAYGSVHFLDETYTEVYRVCARPGNVVPAIANFTGDCYSDLHESQVTSRGTILVSLYNVTRANLSSLGGPSNGWILDSQFYEVDIRTNEIKFGWKSLDHQADIPINATRYKIDIQGDVAGGSQFHPFDYFHINSIELLSDGGYLVSSRQYSSLFKLNSTGGVEWTFPGDGRPSKTFSYIDPRIYFTWQHHARVVSTTSTGMTISLHNNGNSEIDFHNTPSTGVLLQLDLANPAARKATLLKVYSNPSQPEYSLAEGSYQTLSNGNVLLAYGHVPQMLEFSPSGAVLTTWQFGLFQSQANTYRAYRAQWVGKPGWPPKMQFANGSTGVREVFMSWNGATDFEQWWIYAGNTASNMSLVGKVNRMGFETSSPLIRMAHGFARVAAVANGVVLGNSTVVAF